MYRFHAAPYFFLFPLQSRTKNGQCAFPFGLRLTAVIFYNTIFKISVPSKNPS